VDGVSCVGEKENTDEPRDEQDERELDEHAASGVATRSEDEQDGYALEVVSEAGKEIDDTWRGPPSEMANGTAPDSIIRRSRERPTSHTLRDG
jgi:hypothetical protein